MVNNPNQLIVQLFPRDPYNFMVPPPGSTIGPLSAIFTVIANRIRNLQSRALYLEGMISVQNAQGQYLDQHGLLYGVARLTFQGPVSESDDDYRVRILAAINAQKGTIAAIAAAVTNYYISTRPVGTPPPSVTVYDLQSNPAECAIDAENGNPIYNNDFVVSIGFIVSSEDAFFLDSSYLDNAYLIPNGVYYIDPETGVIQAVTDTKAAPEHPVYKLSFVFAS